MRRAALALAGVGLVLALALCTAPLNAAEITELKDRFGAPITDQEAKQILDYLDANYSGMSG